MASLGNPNAENMSHGKVFQRQPAVSPARRVLGDVSPNAKVGAPIADFIASRKTITGSPLKRSFTAAMEDDRGWTYLKKRQMPGDLSSEQPDGSCEQIRRSRAGEVEAEDTGMVFHRAFRPNEMPTINEPSPTEPNTPSDHETDTQDSSAERASFSSLINYDPSSQNAAASQSNSENIRSQVEMLMLSLRVAMYKVRTNQIFTPFEQLQIPDSTHERTKMPSVEEAVALGKQQASLSVSRLGGESSQIHVIPKLLPAPVLLPTAYSSRIITSNHYLPSSPPMSGSPKRSSLQDMAKTTSTPVTRRLINPSFGSPSCSPERLDDRELTSSVVKGQVAEGLLGLRNGA